MIYVLYTSNSLSCNKALRFFAKNNINIQKINLVSHSIDEKMIYDILYLTECGFDEIINKKHIYLVENKIDISKVRVKQMVHILEHEPLILKKPIILQYKDNHPYRLMIGFNKDDIKIFLRGE